MAQSALRPLNKIVGGSQCLDTATKVRGKVVLLYETLPVRVLGSGCIAASASLKAVFIELKSHW